MKDLEELREALCFFGIAAPISHEELANEKERYYRKLTKAVLKYKNMPFSARTPI